MLDAIRPVGGPVLLPFSSYSLGYGRKIVDAIVRGTPDDLNLVVIMDWSGGF